MRKFCAKSRIANSQMSRNLAVQQKSQLHNCRLYSIYRYKGLLAKFELIKLFEWDMVGKLRIT